MIHSFRARISFVATIALVALLLTAPGAAVAAKADDQADSYHSNLKGRIVIAKSGEVASYTIDDKISKALKDLLSNTIEQWRFAPVLIDGEPVNAETQMTVVVEAIQLPDQDYQVRVVEAHFGNRGFKDSSVAPVYPEKAAWEGVGASVALAVLVGEDGRVIGAHPKRTSLSKSFQSERVAKRFRGLFERASMKAVEQWLFDLGDIVDGKPVQQWVVVPIEFTMDAVVKSPGGIAWFPGPVHSVPGLPEDLAKAADGAVAATDQAGPRTLGQRFRLLTPLAPSTL